MPDTKRTRYQELGYRSDAPGLWRIVHMETDQSIGPHYASKAELLADLDRYASEWGAMGSSPTLAADLAVARRVLRALVEADDAHAHGNHVDGYAAILSAARAFLEGRAEK